VFEMGAMLIFPDEAVKVETRLGGKPLWRYGSRFAIERCNAFLR